MKALTKTTEAVLVTLAFALASLSAPLTAYSQTPYLVTDIYPGGSGSGPQSLTNVGGTLFFAAFDGGVDGEELWKSDGTAAEVT